MPHLSITRCASSALPNPGSELLICDVCSSAHVVTFSGEWVARMEEFITAHYDKHGRFLFRMQVPLTGSRG